MDGERKVLISTDEGNLGLYNNHLGPAQVMGYSNDFIVFSFSREYIPKLIEHYFWLVSGVGDRMDLTPGQGSKGPWLRFGK